MNQLNHVAIIMDGNGRWGLKKKRSRNYGHLKGLKAVENVIKSSINKQIPYLTLYTFSTENWTRPQGEVSAIMDILVEVIDQETEALHKEGVRIIHLGRTDRMAPGTRDAVAHAQKVTRNNTQMTLCVAFDYGGRSEILEAVRSLVTSAVPPEALSEDIFSRHLYTAEIPDPDLVIRTGGEQRLSNFLLWQSAYSEFFSTATNWPDLGPKDIEEALESYYNRKRRFGAAGPGV